MPPRRGVGWGADDDGEDDHRSLLAVRHLDLLRTVQGGVPANPDAVVVPSHRPLTWLSGFLNRASVLNCPIIVLWTPQVPVHRAWGGSLSWAYSGLAPAALVTLPADLPKPWRPFASATVTRLAQPPRVDVDTKRNLGLVLGRLLGWRTVLFTDDDVGEPTPASVRKAVGVLERRRAHDPIAAAAWRTTAFPDNSVLCHARRAIGLDQDVFVGGTVLTRLDSGTPFFPPVYNEDWLFLYPWLVDRQVQYAGDMTHQDFDPFADPARASREEFGDLIGEGLMTLLHRRRGLGSVPESYWDGVIQMRHLAMDEVELGLHRMTDELRRQRIHVALDAARSQLRLITAGSLHDYVRAWQADLLRWRADLTRVRPLAPGRAPAPRIEEALTRLGLSEHILWSSWR